MSHHPEVKVSEAEPAEAQQVVDALVRPWRHYSEPRRDDDKPFRRGDIAVQKVSVEGVKYPIYVCVPRDIRTLSGIDVNVKGEIVSLSAPYLDTNNHYEGEQGTVTFVSVSLNKGIPMEAMSTIHPHSYASGHSVFVAMPDSHELPALLIPWQVGDHLHGPIQAMTVTCGFGRSCRWNARIAVFTNPIVR